jgi:hypothetical protein
MTIGTRFSPNFTFERRACTLQGPVRSAESKRRRLRLKVPSARDAALHPPAGTFSEYHKHLSCQVCSRSGPSWTLA